MSESSRVFRAVAGASAAGLVAITVYLVVERSIATGLSLAVCTEQLLQWDASNAYGPAAFSGGWGLAVIGLLMDAVVSTVWAAVFTSIGHARQAPHTLASTINTLVAHTVFFGSPLAYVAAAILRSAPQPSRSSAT